MKGVEPKENATICGTLRSLRLEIFVDRSCAKNYNPKALIAYALRLTLLLGKLEWEVLKANVRILQVL